MDWAPISTASPPNFFKRVEPGPFDVVGARGDSNGVNAPPMSAPGMRSNSPALAAMPVKLHRKKRFRGALSCDRRWLTSPSHMPFRDRLGIARDDPLVAERRIGGCSPVAEEEGMIRVS